MEYIYLTTKREPNSTIVQRTRVQAPTYIVSKQDLQAWREDSLREFLLTGKVSILTKQVPIEIFEKLVKKLYKKLGKNIERYEDTCQFRIPTKRGAFYENIDTIQVYSSDYKAIIAEIKTVLKDDK